MKISALAFYDKLISERGVKTASGFSERGRNTRFEIILKCLQDFPDPNLMLLDYGCNDGELYGRLPNRVKHYIGVDVNQKFVNWARERWKERPVTFWVGNALLDADHVRITKHNADIIVASGVLCCKGDRKYFDELILRLFRSAKQGFIFNVLAADVPRELVNPRLAQQSKELYRWKVEDLLKVIRRAGCNAWDIHRGYLHNDMTVVMRKRWSHFR